MPLLKKLGECFQIAVVGFTRERSQAFFHAKVRLVILEQREIGLGPHSIDYPCAAIEGAVSD